MLMGWTTMGSAEEANRFAREAVERGHAACVQVDGPITSHYRWEDKIEKSMEFRLCFKFLPAQQTRLEAWLLAQHPYKTPEWLVIEARDVGEKYLSWVLANSTH